MNLTQADIDASKMPDGRFYSHTPTGCYTIRYVMSNGEDLCADCFGSAEVALDSPYNNCRPEAIGIYWEGPDLECACCGAKIESSYGDPNEED